MAITTAQALAEYPKLLEEIEEMHDEIKKLRVWKREATVVLMLWDDSFEVLPEEYRVLGKDKSECVKQYIKDTLL